MSPLSPHKRTFRLIVEEIEAPPTPDDNDFVEIVYAGKVFPSTQNRIGVALSQGYFNQIERRLA